MIAQVIAFKQTIDGPPSIVLREHGTGEQFEMELGPWADLIEISRVPVCESDGMVLTSNPPQRRCRHCGSTWSANVNPGPCPRRDVPDWE